MANRQMTSSQTTMKGKRREHLKVPAAAAPSYRKRRLGRADLQALGWRIAAAHGWRISKRLAPSASGRRVFLVGIVGPSGVGNTHVGHTVGHPDGFACLPNFVGFLFSDQTGAQTPGDGDADRGDANER